MSASIRKGMSNHPMSRTGGSATGPLVVANVIAALPHVGYLLRSACHINRIMKTTLPICCSVFLIAGVAWGQDSMTLEQFNTLVAAPGDTNALRAELASLPIWKVAKCSTSFKLPDGRVFTEESVATTKTIGGKYIVCSMDSQYLKGPMRAILVYDEKASAIKSWGIAGGSLAVSTVVLYPERRLTASSGAHGEFMEISVGTYSDTEAFSRLSVYKNGMLSLTRDARYWPMKA